MSKYLLIGGLVAMGLDPMEKFLLVVSHSGRGVYSTDSWSRICRDNNVIYPENGQIAGIGPIEGQIIKVSERSDLKEQIFMDCHAGRYSLLGESDGVTITEKAAEQDAAANP
jgi:hypothetical protein